MLFLLVVFFDQAVFVIIIDHVAGHAEEIAADPSKRMRFCTQAGVDPGAAPYVLQVIREACGSAEEYLAREYGLTPARRMRLRRMYLE